MAHGERRILIDGTMARGGGGFTYLVNVLPRLAAAAPHDRFRVLVRSERLAREIPPAANVEIEVLPQAGLRERFRFTHLELPRIAAAWKADLLYSAGEGAPLRAPCPSIAAFRNPNIFTPLDQGWPLRQRLRLALLRAQAWVSAKACDRILFVSEDSARWISERIGLPEERRAVVHHGIDPRGWRANAEARGSERCILSMSSVYRYKNYVRLIESWTELARRRPDTPDLVILGDDQDPEYSARMRAAREAAGELAERIHILGEVPYAEVRRYYANAAMFVFPSYLETFGHPLLEAMAADLPVVAADIPVFREIAGDAAFYADPHDTASLASAMEAVLASPLAADALVKRGRERVKAFTWERSAQRLLGLCEDVLAGRRAPVREPVPAQAPAWPPAALPWAARSASAPFAARPSAVQQPARL